MTEFAPTNSIRSLADVPPAATREGRVGYDPLTGELTADGAAEVRSALLVLIGASWTMAEQKGFHESGRAFSEQIALMHSELSEALESDRSNEPFVWYADKEIDGKHEDFVDDHGRYRKAEGAAAELADTLIRIGDAVGDNIDFVSAFVDAVVNKNRYNAGRPYKHGRAY